MQNKIDSGRKILYIVISILVSIGIWIYVDDREVDDVTKQFANIPIEFVGENTTLADRGLMLLDSSEEAVTLKLEGSRRMIA
ncbi:MAG: hypothetical protein LKJ86_01995, partial [Oscillibacter sp.]|nr:hypothetical protein [Oscillibacter sp.]